MEYAWRESADGEDSVMMSYGYKSIEDCYESFINHCKMNNIEAEDKEDIHEWCHLYEEKFHCHIEFLQKES